MKGEVKAQDRDMMEMMELVLLSQKLQECKTIKDDKKRLVCFDNLNEKIKVQMKIFQYALDFTANAAANKKDNLGEHEWGKEFSNDLKKLIETFSAILE